MIISCFRLLAGQKEFNWMLKWRKIAGSVHFLSALNSLNHRFHHCASCAISTFFSVLFHLLLLLLLLCLFVPNINIASLCSSSIEENVNENYAFTHFKLLTDWTWNKIELCAFVLNEFSLSLSLHLSPFHSRREFTCVLEAEPVHCTTFFHMVAVAGVLFFIVN